MIKPTLIYGVGYSKPSRNELIEEAAMKFESGLSYIEAAVYIHGAYYGIRTAKEGGMLDNQLKYLMKLIRNHVTSGIG